MTGPVSKSYSICSSEGIDCNYLTGSSLSFQGSTPPLVELRAVFRFLFKFRFEFFFAAPLPLAPAVRFLFDLVYKGNGFSFG